MRERAFALGALLLHAAALSVLAETSGPGPGVSRGPRTEVSGPEAVRITWSTLGALPGGDGARHAAGSAPQEIAASDVRSVSASAPRAARAPRPALAVGAAASDPVEPDRSGIDVSGPARTDVDPAGERVGETTAAFVSEPATPTAMATDAIAPAAPAFAVATLDESASAHASSGPSGSSDASDPSGLDAAAPLPPGFAVRWFGRSSGSRVDAIRRGAAEHLAVAAARDASRCGPAPFGGGPVEEPGRPCRPSPQLPGPVGLPVTGRAAR